MILINIDHVYEKNNMQGSSLQEKKDIGGTMPEDLAPQPSIKPLLDATNRKRKKLPSQSNQDDTITGTSPQDTLWE
jgi:hypothetical protein